MLKKTKYLLSLLFLSFVYSLSEQMSVDSLENTLPGLSNREKARVLNKLSEQYAGTSPEKAITYAKQAYSFSYLLENKSLAAEAMNNIGLAYFNVSEYDSTVKYLNIAEDLARMVPARIYLSKTYYLLGRAYKKKKNYDKAITYFNESFKINEKNGYSSLNNSISILIGDIHFINKNYDQALNLIMKGIDQPASVDMVLLVMAYKDLAKIYESKGNFRNAYLYSQKYAEIKDKLVETRRNEKITELDIKYQSEKKENENELLKRDLEIMEQIQQNQQNIILFFVLVSVLVITIIIILNNRYRHKKATNEVLTQKNSRILKQNKKLEALSQKLIAKNREVSEQNEKLDAIFNNAIVGIGFADQDQQYLYMNKKWCDMLGYSFDEVNNLRQEDVIHPDDRDETIIEMKQLLDGKKEEIRMEKRYIRKDGSVFWGELYASPVKDEMGHIRYTIGVIVDVTERKIAEDSLKRSEHQLREVIATKDKFFSIIAHDLKNPLSVISNMSSHLLKNHGDFSEKKKKAYVQLINESSHTLYKLLENLLEWSRAQTGKINFEPKEFDLHELSRSNVALFEDRAREKNITLEPSRDENSLIKAYYTMINTVMRNLVSNAVKFTQPGGKVKIFSERQNGKYSIYVSDTGVGIDNNDIDKLFRIDESHSTLGTDNEEGTGLGLILCKEFIDKHHGRIDIQSKMGEGTTFVVTLPNDVTQFSL